MEALKTAFATCENNTDPDIPQNSEIFIPKFYNPVKIYFFIL